MAAYGRAHHLGATYVPNIQVDAEIDGYGNSGFLPSLAMLWPTQAGPDMMAAVAHQLSGWIVAILAGRFVPKATAIYQCGAADARGVRRLTYALPE